MKKHVLLSLAGLIPFLLPGSAGAQCPEDWNDPGECDTFYVGYYDSVKYSPPPVSFEAGDANCDGDHSLSDVVFLIDYLYKGGPPPGC